MSRVGGSSGHRDLEVRRETTDLLVAWSNGRRELAEELVDRLYPDLRRLAAARLREAGRDLTLDPTELAHEAYLRLIDQRRTTWRNRAHFFAVASRLVRRVLLEHLRSRGCDKRGGRWTRVTLDQADLGQGARGVDLLALDEALVRLGEVDPRAVRVVELRYFAGLTVEEVAEVTQRSPASVAREWRSARVWLKAHLEGRPPGRPDERE